MAWIEPVTNRITGARMTYIDMNRITGNLDYLTADLSDFGKYAGRTIAKTEWIRNDYVTRPDWKNILDVLEDVRIAIGMTESDYPENPFPEANFSTGYENINNVEKLTLMAYEKWEAMKQQGAANKYVDTEVWTGGGSYVGGFATA